MTFDPREVFAEEFAEALDADPRIPAETALKRVPRSLAAWQATAEWLAYSFAAELGHRFPRVSVAEPSVPSGSAPKSEKWTRAARSYNGLLDRRIRCEAEWKYLRECSAADLMAAAQIRFDHADATRREGERLMALAGAVGDGTVEDLDPALVQEIMA